MVTPCHGFSPVTVGCRRDSFPNHCSKWIGTRPVFRRWAPSEIANSRSSATNTARDARHTTGYPAAPAPSSFAMTADAIVFSSSRSDASGGRSACSRSRVRSSRYHSSRTAWTAVPRTIGSTPQVSAGIRVGVTRNTSLRNERYGQVAHVSNRVADRLPSSARVSVWDAVRMNPTLPSYSVNDAMSVALALARRHNALTGKSPVTSGCSGAGRPVSTHRAIAPIRRSSAPKATARRTAPVPPPEVTWALGAPAPARGR